MAVNVFRSKEKLYGSANYNSWKARFSAILEENELDDIVFNVIEEPTSNAGKLAYKRKQGFDFGHPSPSRDALLSSSSSSC